MLNVHLRFTDSICKALLPVRLRITGPTGGTFVPLGRLPIFPCGRAEELGGHARLGGENFVTIDGGCEVPLPAEVSLRIRASHGPEYELLDQVVVLKPGQMALRFELTRWPIAREGWVSGDLRAHFLSPHAAALEGASEGLDFVQVLARSSSMLARDGNTYPVFSNICEFSGQVPALTAHGCDVFVNTLNTHPMLGSLALLNSHRIVHPLSFGGVDGPDDWSLCDWADQCHRKKGLVVWVDAFRPEASLLGGEALVARILGKIDAIEFDSQPRSQPFLPWYYRMLNAGFLTPLVGSSGKESNRTALGSMRTYVQLGEGGWVEAVRAGRTFTSNGPLLDLTVVDGVATASVESQVPFEKLELVQNGRVVATAVANAGTRFTAEVKCEDVPSGWLAARCIGGAGSSLYPGGPVFAHTSPIQLGAVPEDVRSTAIGQLRECVTSTQEWIESEGRFSTPKSKEQMLAKCEEALAVLGTGAL
jgi:hypothetical protein